MIEHSRIIAVLAAAGASSPNYAEPYAYADLIDDARELGVNVDAAFASADAWTSAELVAILGAYATAFDVDAPCDRYLAIDASNRRGGDLAMLMDLIGEWHFSD